MSWISPEIPRRFRHVHRQWSEMSFSERETHKARLARCADYAGLAFFEAWQEWLWRESSPLARKREGER